MINLLIKAFTFLNEKFVQLITEINNFMMNLLKIKKYQKDGYHPPHFFIKKSEGYFFASHREIKTEYTFVKTSIPMCESTSHSVAVRHEAVKVEREH